MKLSRFGPVHLGVEASTSLSAETRQLTTVRDHLSLSHGDYTLPLPYNSPNEYDLSILPQTSFVATSETFNSVNFQPLTITGHFDMDITIPFIGKVNVHWSHEFFSLSGVTLDHPTGQSSESNRLRVGQYSDCGNDFSEEGTTGRVVMSHLPSPHFFASWPWANPEDPRDVPSCLEDDEVPPPPPPPPPPPQIDPVVPSSEMCAYGPSSPCFGEEMQCSSTITWCDEFPGWQLPANACNLTVRTQWLSQFSGAEHDCFSAMLEYLCGVTMVSTSSSIRAVRMQRSPGPRRESWRRAHRRVR